MTTRPHVLLLALACLGLVSPARAATVSFPGHINLVDMKAGVPDAAHGQFVVQLASMPTPPIVTIDFTSTPDVQIGMPQPDPTLTVSCPFPGLHPGVVSAPVDPITFAATFTIVGASTGLPHGTPGPLYAVINADGVSLGRTTVATYDMDGVGGVGLSDLSLWAIDLFSGSYVGRSDFNGDGFLSLADLGLWAEVYFQAKDIQSAGGYCP